MSNMLAACTIRPDLTVAAWNQPMESICDLALMDVLDKPLSALPEPWSTLLLEFIHSDLSNRLNIKLHTNLSLNLYKTLLAVDKKYTDRKSRQEQESNESHYLIIVENTREARGLNNQLLHKERLASIGQVAAGVAHEIGNPVTGIACLAQNIKLESQNPEMQSTAEQILEQTERISTILQSLTYFVHGNTQGQKKSGPVQIKKCVDDAIRLLSLGAKNTRIKMINHCSPEIRVEGDSQRLTQIFVNVLTNACDATPEFGRIETFAMRENREIRIDILDEGCGIPATELGSIFEPFFTTKDPGTGTGLGLAIVKSIVNEHMGTITAMSPANPNQYPKNKAEPGTRFSILLPEFKSKQHF